MASSVLADDKIHGADPARSSTSGSVASISISEKAEEAGIEDEVSSPAPAHCRGSAIDVEKQQDHQEGDREGHGRGDDPAKFDGEEDPVPGPLPCPPASPAALPPRTRLQAWTTMAALSSGLFLAALDNTVVTTAVPTISHEFGSSLGYVWTGTAYMLANAAVAPTWGKVSDIWGRKPVLLAAMAVFWIGSLVCALSSSIGMLLAGRAVQGVGAGGIGVLSNICISDLFSVRSRSLYYGVFGGVWAIAGAVGPVVGGVFTTTVTWRWCFYINLPIGGASFLILAFALRLHNPRTPVGEGLRAVDWGGSLAIIGGTLMFLLGLESGGVQYPWGSPTVVCLIVFGAVVIGLFAVYEATVPRYPIISGRIFRSWSNVAVYCYVACHAFVFMGGTYWLPLYFQAVLGRSALWSGVYVLPFVLALSAPALGVGFVIKKTGRYWAIGLAGALLLTTGAGLLIDLGPRLVVAKLILYQIVAGIGVGPGFQVPIIVIQNNVEARDIATATSTLGFVRQLSAAVSVVAGGAVFNNAMQRQAGALAAEIGPGLAAQLSGSNAAASVSLVATMPGHAGEVARAAYWQGWRTMFYLYVAVAGLATVLYLFIQEKPLSSNHTEHRTGLAAMRAEEEEAVVAAAALEM